MTGLMVSGWTAAFAAGAGLGLLSRLLRRFVSEEHVTDQERE